MSILNGQRVIAIEEHFMDPQVGAHFKGADAKAGGPLLERLEDLGEGRIKSMDEAGIDMQVLSQTAPSLQRVAADVAAEVARGANDRLHAVCKNHPDRFAAFGALPTADPKAAADELERTVDKLGFCGAMIHGLTNSTEFIDDEKFWPIFERAAALNVPIYMHPARPHQAVLDAYLKDYADRWPGFVVAAWGYTMETATAGIRMVMSGVFDKHPNLKIILGHMGETLPFLKWRIDFGLNRPGNEPIEFDKIFSEHFYITTSGFFSDPAMLCCIQEMGVDRILFAVDYPYVPNKPGPEWMERLMLNDEDKAKILHGNSERLLGV
ncbi:MAG: amidohydrolase [Rhodospirillales bacterium]|nr:amidohydrolase [Rhodospirillales bacterium]